jgi:hypothetical protein
MEPSVAEATHWTGAAIAEAAGVSVSSVQRISRSHGLQPHCIGQFKVSKDTASVDKLRDVVGLYVDPPAQTVVLSVDEKSQIEALDRTQPSLPMKKGRAGTMTLLQTPWNDDAVCGDERGRNRDRPQHAAPSASGVHPLPRDRRAVRAGRQVDPRHLDNYAAHKHPQVPAWVAEHPRWTVPLHADVLLNAVEGFFSKLTRQSLKRGVFRSVGDFESPITRDIAATNGNPKPFVWTATAKTIQAKLTRNRPSESVHCG